MKKAFISVLILAAVLSVSSCGNSGKKKDAKPAETEVVVEAENVETCSGCEGCPSPDGCGTSEDPEAVHGTCCGNS